jgi:hypothetical protein
MLVIHFNHLCKVGWRFMMYVNYRQQWRRNSNPSRIVLNWRWQHHRGNAAVAEAGDWGHGPIAAIGDMLERSPGTPLLCYCAWVLRAADGPPVQMAPPPPLSSTGVDLAQGLPDPCSEVVDLWPPPRAATSATMTSCSSVLETSEFGFTFTP